MIKKLLYVATLFCSLCHPCNSSWQTITNLYQNVSSFATATYQISTTVIFQPLSGGTKSIYDSLAQTPFFTNMLMDAIRVQDPEKVKSIFTWFPSNVHFSRDPLTGESALNLALICSAGKPRPNLIVKLLLARQYYAPSEPSGPRQNTPLINAAEVGDEEAVKNFLKWPFDEDQTNNIGENALLKALQKRNTTIARLLLKQKKVSIKQTIMTAEQQNDTATLKYAAQLVDDDNNTLLHLCKDLPTATCLIKAGAPISAKNKNNASPLYVHIKAGRNEIADHLIKCGVKENLFAQARQEMRKGDTILMHYLLKNKLADVNACDSRGNNALHDAPTLAITKLLVQNGINPNKKNANGETPLHKVKDASVFWFLVEHGANPHTNDNNDCPPLFTFMSTGKKTAAPLNLKTQEVKGTFGAFLRYCKQHWGINFNKEDANGSTLIHHTVTNPNVGWKAIEDMAKIVEPSTFTKKNRYGATPQDLVYNKEQTTMDAIVTVNRDKQSSSNRKSFATHGYAICSSNGSLKKEDPLKRILYALIAQKTIPIVTTQALLNSVFKNYLTDDFSSYLMATSKSLTDLYDPKQWQCYEISKNWILLLPHPSLILQVQKKQRTKNEPATMLELQLGLWVEHLKKFNTTSLKKLFDTDFSAVFKTDETPLEELSAAIKNNEVFIGHQAYRQFNKCKTTNWELYKPRNVFTIPLPNDKFSKTTTKIYAPRWAGIFYGHGLPQTLFLGSTVEKWQNLFALLAKHTEQKFGFCASCYGGNKKFTSLAFPLALASNTNALVANISALNYKAFFEELFKAFPDFSEAIAHIHSFTLSDFNIWYGLEALQVPALLQGTSRQLIVQNKNKNRLFCCSKNGIEVNYTVSIRKTCPCLVYLCDEHIEKPIVFHKPANYLKPVLPSGPKHHVPAIVPGLADKHVYTIEKLSAPHLSLTEVLGMLEIPLIYFSNEKALIINQLECDGRKVGSLYLLKKHESKGWRYTCLVTNADWAWEQTSNYEPYDTCLTAFNENLHLTKAWMKIKQEDIKATQNAYLNAIKKIGKQRELQDQDLD